MHTKNPSMHSEFANIQQEALCTSANKPTALRNTSIDKIAVALPCQKYFKPKTTPLCPCVLGMPKHHTLPKPNMLSRRSPVLLRGCVRAEGSSYMKLFLNSSVDPRRMHHPHASHGVIFTGLTCSEAPRSHLPSLDASLHDALP